MPIIAHIMHTGRDAPTTTTRSRSKNIKYRICGATAAEHQVRRKKNYTCNFVKYVYNQAYAFVKGMFSLAFLSVFYSTRPPQKKEGRRETINQTPNYICKQR